MGLPPELGGAGGGGAVSDPMFVVKTETAGLDDPGPYLTFRQSCSCGAILSDRTFDARSESLGNEIDAVGAADGAAAREHLEAHGGGFAVNAAGEAFVIEKRHGE